jgi:hypothetical protein
LYIHQVPMFWINLKGPLTFLSYPNRDIYSAIFSNVSLYLTDERDAPGLIVIVLISRQKQVQNNTNKIVLILISSVTDFYNSRFS